MKYILQCEDSVEGIFSAVYSVWELKYVKEEVSVVAVGTDDILDMELFANYVKLQPSAEKAFKVIQAIQSRYLPQLWEKLYYTACSDGTDKADVVYHYIKLLLEKGNQIANDLSNPYVLRVMELSRAVGNESHHYLGFLRFIETPQQILLAKYNPKNNITGIIIHHFVDRLPQERFLIWDTKRNIAGIHIPGQEHVLMYLSKEQEEFLQQYQDDKMQIEDLWKIFVENISIKERENKELQRNNIPLRFRGYMPEFQKNKYR